MKVFSELFKGIKVNNKYLEVFKNPNYKEIEDVKKQSHYSGLRGIIQDDGTVYIWTNDILHKDIVQYCPEIDINSFRFAQEDGSSWIIDLHQRWEAEDGKKLIEQYKSILSQFGDINKLFQIFYSTDTEYETYKVASRLRKNVKLAVSRLRKNSEFAGAFKKHELYCEIFKNPTSSEINDIISNSPYDAIRGVIYDDGTVYAWDGDVLHDEVNYYSKDFKIDIDKFRFAYSSDGVWIIDLHGKYSLNEAKDIIEKYKHILSQFGDINQEITLFYASDSKKTYDEYFVKDYNKTVAITANTKTLNDFYNSNEYDFIDIGLQTINVDDIVGMSSPRNEEYNEDFSPKDPSDSRWIYQDEKVKNGEKLEPIQLIEMPNGKYVINGDGNHRLSAAKYNNLSQIDAYVSKMISKKENINSQWEEYAKDKVKQYDDMILTYKNMYDEYNKLMDIYFDNKTKENYQKYKNYENELNDFSTKMKEYKEKLDEEEYNFKNEKIG